MEDVAAQHNKSAAVRDCVYSLNGEPLLSQISVLLEPVCDFGWSLAQVSDVWFDVDGSLVPEMEAIVVSHTEAVCRDP